MPVQAKKDLFPVESTEPFVRVILDEFVSEAQISSAPDLAPSVVVTPTAAKKSPYQFRRPDITAAALLACIAMASGSIAWLASRALFAARREPPASSRPAPVVPVSKPVVAGVSRPVVVRLTASAEATAVRRSFTQGRKADTAASNAAPRAHAPTPPLPLPRLKAPPIAMAAAPASSPAVFIPIDPSPADVRQAAPEPPREIATTLAGLAGLAAATPAIVAPTSEEPAVRGLLAEFQAAYDRLDAEAAKDLWPSVDERALAKAFGNLESQTIAWDNCRIHLGSGKALAYCSGPATYVGRLGNKTQSRHLNWTFALAKAPGGWHIDTVEIR
jgi:hypothetical protein